MEDRRMGWGAAAGSGKVEPLQTRIIKLFSLHKVDLDVVAEIADARVDANTVEVYECTLMSYGCLRQHGIHVTRVKELLTEALPKIQEDAGDVGTSPRRRHPAWVIIDNKYIRYGYHEVDGSPLEHWTTIEPGTPPPRAEEIARPVVLTIYNLSILKARLQ